MSVMLPTKMQSEWLPIEHCSVTAFLVYKFLQACNPKYFNLFTNQDAECTMLTEIKTLVQSSKLGIYVPFSSQCHIETDPQYYR